LESALRIYSNRERRQHLGPRALERLKCASIADAEVVGTLAPEHNSPSEHLIKESISEYSRLFSTLLEGPVAPKSAPIPDDLERRAENLKASAYFLDATLAGCCLLGETDWFGKSNGGMRRAMMAWIAEQSGGDYTNWNAVITAWRNGQRGVRLLPARPLELADRYICNANSNSEMHCNLAVSQLRSI
jgi:hypothetical protein